MRREKGQRKMTLTNFKPVYSKNPRRLYTMVGFLVLLLAFVATTFFLITKESRNEQEWIRLSTDLQVNSQQLAKSAVGAVEGNSCAFLELEIRSSIITDAVAALKHGDPIRSLPALSVPPCQTGWTHYSVHLVMSVNINTKSILDREKLILNWPTPAADFMNAIPEIQELTDERGTGTDPSKAPSNTDVRRQTPTGSFRPHSAASEGNVAWRRPAQQAAADNFAQEIEYFEQTHGRPAGRAAERRRYPGTKSQCDYRP